MPPVDPRVGTRVGDYAIESRIGSGAMATVYRARNDATRSVVALKLLHEDMGAIPALRRRFDREIRALEKLQHDRIVRIVDFGLVDAQTFIAMELIEGMTLEEVLRSEPIELDRAIRIVEQMLEGLEAAHGLDLVHRDLKPANVMLRRTDRGEMVKLLDFGLVKFLSTDELSQDGTLTRKGRLVGTPAYMSPEQIAGLAVDARADVYAMGVILYELLADRRPFLYERRSELLRAHLSEPVPPIEEARPGLIVAPPLAEIVDLALSKDPAKRFADAGDMLRAVRALPPRPARVESKRPPSATRTREATFSGVVPDEDVREAVSVSGLRPVEAPGRRRSSAPPAARATTRRPEPVWLWVVALVLSAIAAGLWLTIKR